MIFPFVKSPYFQSRSGQKIVGIVLHTMVGTYKGTISYFQSNTSQVSAHYCVDLNGDITQMVDEKDASNHAGIVSVPTFKQTLARPGMNPNWYTIGIEHADNSNPAGADRKNQYPASIQLVADICKRYSIPCDREHICGHREIRSTKSCPGNFDVDYVVREAQKLLSPQPAPEVPEPLQKYGKGSLTDLVTYIDEQNRFLTEARAEVSSLRQEIGTKNDVIENLGAQEKGFWDRISVQLPTEYTKDEKGLTERLSYASSLEDKYTSVQKAFDEAKNKYVGDLSNAQAQILSLKTAVERLEKQVADLQAQATIHKPDEVFSLVQKILKLLGKKK